MDRARDRLPRAKKSPNRETFFTWGYQRVILFAAHKIVSRQLLCPFRPILAPLLPGNYIRWLNTQAGIAWLLATTQISAQRHAIHACPALMSCRA